MISLCSDLYMKTVICGCWAPSLCEAINRSTTNFILPTTIHTRTHRSCYSFSLHYSYYYYVKVCHKPSPACDCIATLDPLSLLLYRFRLIQLLLTLRCTLHRPHRLQSAIISTTLVCVYLIVFIFFVYANDGLLTSNLDCVRIFSFNNTSGILNLAIPSIFSSF